MNTLIRDFIILIIIALIIFLYAFPRYNKFLPTIPVYNNKEVLAVKKQSQNRNLADIRYFEITDPTVVYAFLNDVDEKREDLENIIKQAPNSLIMFLKYLFNRPRPAQLDPSINVIESETANTPSYPAGHSFQAHYLAYKLGQKYPDKKERLCDLADRCDEVRVKAGLHYPSDGVFSKKIVGYLEKMGM